jgi:Protein of unknown function (DUF3551)
MRRSVIVGLALCAAFAAFAGKTHAEVNYPWCLMGDTRAVDCYFSSREQCAKDGRNRGFGGQCIKNPSYKPGAVSGKKPIVSQTASPSRVSLAHQSAPTCTGLKSVCISYYDRWFAAAPPPLAVWRAWREAGRISLERERP